jgi:hypothetical protein
MNVDAHESVVKDFHLISYLFLTNLVFCDRVLEP